MGAVQHFHFSALATALLNISLVGLIAYRAPLASLKWRFVWYGCAIAWWSFFLYLFSSSSVQEASYAFCQSLHAASIFIPCFFLHFLLAYLNRWSHTQKKILLIAYLISSFFWFSDVLFPSFFIAGVVPKLGFPYFMEPGILYHFWMAFFFAVVIYGHILLLQGVTASKGQLRKQRLFFLIGNAVGYLGGIGSFFPVYDITWFPYPYGTYGVALFSVVTAYAILRFRFMDIEVIIKKTIVFAGLLSFVYAVFAVASHVLNDVLSSRIGLNRWISLAISVIIIVFGYDNLRRLLVHVTENILFQKAIDYEKIDRDIADQIQITDLPSQLRNIVEIFREGFALENARIFLLDDDLKSFRLAYQAGDGRDVPEDRIGEDDKVIDFLDHHRGHVVLKSALLSTSEDEMNHFFTSWYAEVACKITFRDSVIAILLLGKKKSDREFVQKDIDFLEKLSKNLGVSINNAKTFQYKQDYYVLMAEKNKTDVLARLSEGIDHEIKNPLNAIKPAAQRIQYMVRKGGPFSTESLSKMNQFLDMIVRNSDRITSIMNRLRNFARPIRTAEGFKLEPIQVRDLVDEAIDLVSRKQLEVDGIVIENLISDNVYIFGEHASVIQVFWNLIANAYHAIDRDGKIVITARDSETDGKVVVEVKDTGRGIHPEDVDKIFTPFFTTKPTNIGPESTARFTGTGLGLCYVKQYMEGLGGSITCETSLGKGTSFYLKFLKVHDHARKAA